MAKFKPGDSVWIRQPPEATQSLNYLPVGEHPTVVKGLVEDPLCYWPDVQHYVLDMQPPPGRRRVVAPEFALRPRRDDYQQHEGLGTREQLDDIIHHEDNVPVLEDARS